MQVFFSKGMTKKQIKYLQNYRTRKDQAVLYEKFAKDLAVRTRGADLPGRIGVINLAIKISGFDGVLLRINNRQMCIATEKFA